MLSRDEVPQYWIVGKVRLVSGTMRQCMREEKRNSSGLEKDEEGRPEECNIKVFKPAFSRGDYAVCQLHEVGEMENWPGNKADVHGLLSGMPGRKRAE